MHGQGVRFGGESVRGVVLVHARGVVLVHCISIRESQYIEIRGDKVTRIYS